MNCENCEWYRYPLLTDNSLKNKPIPTVICDQRRCERGWCDKDFKRKFKTLECVAGEDSECQNT